MIDMLNGNRNYIKSEDLLDNLVADGWYDKESKQIKDLANVLKELTPIQYKLFLLFLTSVFAALEPLISVVIGSPDENALHSAATCFNRLKLPPYKDKEIMKEKLIKSIEDC